MSLIRADRRRSGFDHPVSSEITPQAVYAERRAWLVRSGLAGAGLLSSMATPGLMSGALAQSAATARPGKLAALAGAHSSVSGAMVMDKPTAYTDASSYNNYYEFGTDKSDPARNAGKLVTRPWTVSVEG